MNILIYRWKAYNYIDIIQTFTDLGHHVDQIEEHLDNYDESPKFERRLAYVLQHGTLPGKQNQMSMTKSAENENEAHNIVFTGYDFVFTVNYFACISHVCQSQNVKYVCWTCDNPLISMHHQSVFNPCNYIFTFDKTNHIEFTQMGVKHIWYLPLAVDTNRIDYMLEQATDLHAYQNDIAFVGSLYERNTYDKLEKSLPEFLRGYFEATMQAQMSVSGANIIEPMLTEEILAQLQQYFKLEKSKDSFSDLGLIFSTTVLGFKIASMERRKACICQPKIRSTAH